MKKKIARTTAVKLLGVLLDARLSWKPHITELSKKLARIVGIFCKVRHLVPLETKNFIFFSVLLLCNLWYSCLGTNT